MLGEGFDEKKGAYRVDWSIPFSKIDFFVLGRMLCPPTVGRSRQLSDDRK